MKPSEAIRDRRCPACAGWGEVHKVVSDETGECGLCGGAGVWPPPYAEAIDNEHGPIAIIFGDQVAHRDTCARVKSQRRLMNERRAARAHIKGPLFQSAAELDAFLDDRDPCDCGGVPINTTWPE